MAVEKPLALRAWKSQSDFHFPPATAATANRRLHFKCRDKQTFGYIQKWLDRSGTNSFRTDHTGLEEARQGPAAVSRRVLTTVFRLWLNLPEKPKDQGFRVLTAVWAVQRRKLLA
jgi:hypothetical protein